MEHTPLIYIIAGESSGDYLGAGLIRELTQKYDGKVRFAGIGGPHMQAAGLPQSLFPMEEISVMGLTEIIPHALNIKRRIKQTAKDIAKQKPDAVITIDSGGFCTRVVSQVQEKMTTLPQFIHYVAPTVWAYKPERAEKYAQLFDHILCLLPFEPKYFTQQGGTATFVKHPVAYDAPPPANAAGFMAGHRIDVNTTKILLLPGSRMGEINRHLPIFEKTAELLAKNHENLHFILPVLPHCVARVKEQVRGWKIPCTVVDSSKEKHDAFAAADLALAKNGTVGVELARAGVAHVTTYRMNPLTAALARPMIKINRFSLINILDMFSTPVAARVPNGITSHYPGTIIPECMQENCTPRKLAAALEPLIASPRARAAQVEQAQATLRQIGFGDIHSPSQRAAEVVYEMVQARVPHNRPPPAINTVDYSRTKTVPSVTLGRSR